VVLLADIGSAVLSVRALIAGGDLDSGRALLADAPLVEGSVAAAVAASTGMNLGGVVAAAAEAWDVRKL
jgi:PTS hybrid protein